jgi:hypothetical protein
MFLAQIQNYIFYCNFIKGIAVYMREEKNTENDYQDLTKPLKTKLD